VILEAVGALSEELMRREDWEALLPEMLYRLGEGVEASRAFVFEAHQDERGRYCPLLKAAWGAPGVSTTPLEAYDGRRSFSEMGLDRWQAVLEAGGTVAGPASHMLPEEQNQIQQTNARSVALVPVLAQGKLWGAIGFSDVRGDRIWTVAELDALRAAGGVLGARIQHYWDSIKLREREELLRSIFDRLQDVFFHLDLEGNLRMVSPSVKSMLGYDPEEVLGWHVSAFYKVPQDHQQLRDALWNQGAVHDHHLLMRRKDGSELHASVTARSVLDGEGNPLGAEGIVRDVTERELSQERLRETLEELERSNQELENFAYIASHDLQEPLRMVTSYLELLGDRYGDRLDDKAQTYMDFAVDGALRMRQLIDDLLAFSRVKTTGQDFAHVDLSELLEEVQHDLQPALRESGGELHLPEAPPPVYGDPSQLRQLFQNMIGNALKFRGDRSPLVRVGIEQQEEHWLLWCQDNGIGMDPTNTDRIFTIFQRLHTRREYEGNGVGLAICKRIVERHGGTIWVDTEPGAGSTFYFTLPRPALHTTLPESRFTCAEDN
jgi:PAS domain S-box-containing protein